ncbi:MAG: DNA adenine methylase [Clostridia bacterium]|nr:DNA adenine methylase [Clostridia bacterium]
MRELIKSPLNYTGNKYRILNQMAHKFPSQIDCMIDLFCGGATVGLNVEVKKVYFIDNNERVINLLVYLAKQNFDHFLKELEEVIEEYHLSYSFKYGYSIYRSQCSNSKDNNGLKDYNADGYYRLRSYYNGLSDKNTDEANRLLYLLMVYAFNNDIRFNATGEFNLPVGKTDLNKMNVVKIKKYIERVNSIDAVFLCMDFTAPELIQLIDEADFIYMDPPYLVGDAVYNMSWDYKKEYALLDFMDMLLQKKKRFALSNVIAKVGHVNEPLSYWCYKHKENITITDIDYNYRSSSYNKIKRDAREREVLLTPNGDYNED